MNYYKQIKDELINNEIYKKAKDYSKNKSDLMTYYNVGKLIIEAQGGEERAKYGDGLIKEYSKRLTMELGKGYSTRSLKNMRRFYLLQKGQPVAAQLSWSHYCILMSIKENVKYNYYLYISKKLNLSKRELQERIKSNEYERLSEETKLKLISNTSKMVATDFVKNPIIIRNKNNIDYDKISEKLLKQLILEDIEHFLKELGEGFSYIDNEYKIKIGNNYHYIDILLFNYIYNSFIVVELKVTNLKVEYIAQVQKYMNYIDKNVKKEFHNNTVGIIICRKDDKYVIEYCSDERIKRVEYICE